MLRGLDLRSQVRDAPPRQKQNGHPFQDDRLFLVDDTRLEKQKGCVALYRPVLLSVDNTMFS